VATSILTNHWVRLILLGVAYFVIGYGSTFLVRPSIQFWRLAAWLASAGVYFAHLAYEHFRLENSPVTTALHTATAVALGGLLLAVAATTHAMMVTEHAPLSRFLIALVVWPLITGVPAFVVTLVIALGLQWLKIPRRASA
jgi:hypothetical protein